MIEEMAARIKTTHAKHDPAHCNAPKVFRSLKKGKRDRNLVTYQNGREQITFACFESLGVEEMKILQAVVALSGPDGLILDPEPKTSLGTQLRLFMDCKYDAIAAKTMMVKESMRTLLNELGLTAGDANIKSVLRGLERMNRVVVGVKGPQGEIGGFTLLSYAWENPRGKRWDKGRLAISINPRLTQTILGGKGTKYVRIDMHEVRALRGDAAALIHQRLCGWIDPGKTGRVETETLMGYVYGELAEGAAARKQKSRVLAGLKELAELPGWKIREYAQDRWIVSRPEIPQEIEGEVVK